MKPHLILALKISRNNNRPHALIKFTASDLPEYIVTAQQSAAILARHESWHKVEVCSIRVLKLDDKLSITWATVGICPHPTLTLVEEWIHYNASEIWVKACGLLAQIQPETVKIL